MTLTRMTWGWAVDMVQVGCFKGPRIRASPSWRSVADGGRRRHCNAVFVQCRQALLAELQMHKSHGRGGQQAVSVARHARRGLARSQGPLAGQASVPACNVRNLDSSKHTPCKPSRKEREERPFENKNKTVQTSIYMPRAAIKCGRHSITRFAHTKPNGRADALSQTSCKSCVSAGRNSSCRLCCRSDASFLTPLGAA